MIVVQSVSAALPVNGRLVEFEDSGRMGSIKFVIAASPENRQKGVHIMLLFLTQIVYE